VAILRLFRPGWMGRALLLSGVLCATVLASTADVHAATPTTTTTSPPSAATSTAADQRLLAAANRTMNAKDFTLLQYASIGPTAKLTTSSRLLAVSHVEAPQQVLTAEYPVTKKSKSGCRTYPCTKALFLIKTIDGTSDITVGQNGRGFHLTSPTYGSASVALYGLQVLTQAGTVTQKRNTYTLNLPCPPAPAGDASPSTSGYECLIPGITKAVAVIRHAYISKLTVYEQDPTSGVSYTNSPPPLEPVGLFVVSKLGTTPFFTKAGGVETFITSHYLSRHHPREPAS